jgi:transcriptional regulator with XRE-family HTH domain
MMTAITKMTALTNVTRLRTAAREHPMTPAAPDPRARFGARLSREMDERGLSNMDLVRLLKHGYDRSSISQWKRGQTLPSEPAVLHIARVLHLSGVDLAREAGYDDFATELEEMAARGLRDPLLAALEDLGAPARTRRIADDYRNGIEGVRRRAELELAQLRREMGAEAERADAATTWSDWARRGAADAGITIADFVRESDHTIDEKTADAWERGSAPAEPTAAILVARILTHLGAPRDDADALAAAGHHGMAELIRTVRATGAAEKDEDPAPDGGARVS